MYEIVMEAPPRFELGIKLLQSFALPLGYGANFLERKTGIEPATLALARRCSTAEPLPHIMAGDTGFEPVMTESKSVALPLG